VKGGIEGNKNKKKNVKRRKVADGEKGVPLK
jgi:hypothetical protein